MSLKAAPPLLPSSSSMAPPGRRRKVSGRRLPTDTLPAPPPLARRASLTSGGPKVQRTSKTSQKLVVLPSAPQTRPLVADEDLTLGHETGEGVREYKSQAERMTKEQREEAGFKRITAYCMAESLKMKLLASFLKREHNVVPRVFDEALYVMYHLPLLPGYGPDTNIRSSVPKDLATTYLSQLSEAEENGYQGTYFPSSSPPRDETDGYIATTSPLIETHVRASQSAPDVSEPLLTTTDEETEIEPPSASDTKVVLNTLDMNADVEAQNIDRFASSPPDQPYQWTDGERNTPTPTQRFPRPTSSSIPASSSFPPAMRPQRRRTHHHPHHHELHPARLPPEDEVAEVVFFEYGVVVFFGLLENQEKDIIEDIAKAGVLRRPFGEEDWEVEQCHFVHDPHIAYPRIYNDFFTLKSRSHLLKLSIAHAFAQSTLLARYETLASHVLSSPLALSIPKQLATTGYLTLKRHDALKLTGRLFKLRRDVILVSGVLDVPELFWSEASLGDLYGAVREYMEIKGRVTVLNERLAIASDFLEAIHDHLNSNEMTRITWIVIWLIVVAVVVELGEVFARLIVHAATRQNLTPIPTPISKEEALRTLERMMNMHG